MTRLSGQHRNAKSQVFRATPNFKPRRDRAIDSKIVVCPSCGAAEGDPCTLISDPSRRARTVHPHRRRLAIRLLRERGEL